MKITAIIMQSLDGFLARSNNDDLSWGSRADRNFFIEKTKEIGTMLMGSTTFDNMKGTNGKAFNSRNAIVFTSRLAEYQNYSSEFGQVRFVSDTPQSVISELESNGVTEAALIGGGHLIHQFLETKLVNEIYTTITPKLFGSGIKMCAEQLADLNLKLLDFSKISDNELLLHYKVEYL
jgi:dihydrofolate reductase